MTIASDFSGVGAFNQALIRLGIEYDEVFACEMDKFARKSFIANYGEPKYFPTDVYEREIPVQNLDVYVTSPPCQSFSIAGKRQGKLDKRGILFFNSHEFIQVNKPRFFIFENVKGLLSHDRQNKDAAYGRTFQEWINLLGGKSVNGVPVIFPDADSIPYHIYFKVLNGTDFNVPQNRERVFIVGIRDDEDNSFSWPCEIPLTKCLTDVLEVNPDKKYNLSEKMIDYLLNRSDNFNGGKVNFKSKKDIASCLNKSSGHLDISDNILLLGNTNPSGNGQNGNVYSSDGISPTLSTNKGEGIKIIQMNEAKEFGSQPRQHNRVYDSIGIVPTLTKGNADANIYTNQVLRKLTPLESFRLMDFPDSFVDNCITTGISDSQLYKQAGNSVIVACYEKIMQQILKIINNTPKPIAIPK